MGSYNENNGGAGEGEDRRKRQEEALLLEMGGGGRPGRQMRADCLTNHLRCLRGTATFVRFHQASRAGQNPEEAECAHGLFHELLVERERRANLHAQTLLFSRNTYGRNFETLLAAREADSADLSLILHHTNRKGFLVGSKAGLGGEAKLFTLALAAHQNIVEIARLVAADAALKHHFRHGW